MKIIYLQFSLDHEMLLPSILYIMQQWTYAATKFKAAAADGLEEITITWNRRHEHMRTRMDRRTDRFRWTNFGTKLMYPFYYKKRRV